MAVEPKTPINTYREWQKEEGLPAMSGLSVKDLNQVELAPWKRRGGLGAYINLQGTGDCDDAYVCEIPPGESLKPDRHLFEELVFVLKGRGATSVWTERGAKQTFEWQAGSMFVPPQMWFHQHFNTGSTPVRYMALKHSGTKYYISSAIFPKEIGKDLKEEGGQQIEYEDEDRGIHQMFENDLAASGAQCNMKSMVDWCTA